MGSSLEELRQTPAFRRHSANFSTYLTLALSAMEGGNEPVALLRIARLGGRHLKSLTPSLSLLPWKCTLI